MEGHCESCLWIIAEQKRFHAVRACVTPSVISLEAGEWTQVTLALHANTDSFISVVSFDVSLVDLFRCTV